jgi:hypothetical protein
MSSQRGDGVYEPDTLFDEGVSLYQGVVYLLFRPVATGSSLRESLFSGEWYEHGGRLGTSHNPSGYLSQGFE